MSREPSTHDHVIDLGNGAKLGIVVQDGVAVIHLTGVNSGALLVKPKAGNAVALIPEVNLEQAMASAVI